ncbi:MAG TPA: isocitrate lyase/PEP mutase family protein [Ilumatobacteraceae bacterium]|nr:isocitrate lyase/PEP mutase family protein [Ilumatobacteraceae bacterium]
MTNPPTETPRAALRRMLAEPDVLVLPGVYDALSASLAARSGFRGAYMTGAGVSMSLIGHPDLGFTTLTEMAGQVGRITAVLDVPLVADADTGFGNPLSVQRTVTEYQRAGVAGLHIEDQAFPKRCGHLDGKTVIAASEFVEKVRAAVEARTDPDLVLIARTDARAPLGYDEAIRRANRYAEAGADLIFVEAPQSLDEVARIPQEVAAPVLYNWVTGGHSPAVELAQLREWGYATAIIPGLLIGTVVRAMIQALARAGAPTPMSDDLRSPAAMFDTVGLSDWLAVADRFTG